MNGLDFGHGGRLHVGCVLLVPAERGISQEQRQQKHAAGNDDEGYPEQRTNKGRHDETCMSTRRAIRNPGLTVKVRRESPAIALSYLSLLVTGGLGPSAARASSLGAPRKVRALQSPRGVVMSRDWFSAHGDTT
jgi:hypothetical protein